MTKPPSVLILFSVTLHLVRGVREMGKHTLISLSGKWYIFLCNPYLEGEGLWLSFSQRVLGFWESCGCMLSIISKGRTFPTWLLTLAPKKLFLCNEKSVSRGVSPCHCPLNMYYPMAQRGEERISHLIDLTLTGSMMVEYSLQTQYLHSEIMTLILSSVGYS